MGKKYKSPPVIEAVCEFRFDPRSAFDLTHPGLIYKELQGDFPKRKQARIVETTFEPAPGGLQQKISQTDRVQFFRNDGIAIVQVGPNLLAVNHLEPYPTWDEYLPLIERALLTYKGVAEPKGYHRISLRYLNRIYLEPPIDLEDYFNFYPFRGKALPEDYVTFNVSLQFPFFDDRDILRIELTSGAVRADGALSVNLNLEYFLAKTDGVALDEEIEWLNKAHERIESSFEGCIQDVLRNKFEEVR